MSRRAVAEQVSGAAGVVDPLGPLAFREGASPSRLGVLRHRHFRNIWLAAFLSSVGGWMEFVGIQWVMAQKTGSPLMMALLTAAQLGPTLILGIPGGLLADRVNRKKLLLATQALQMVIAALLCAGSYEGWLSPLFLVLISLAQGMTIPFNIPAWQVLTPRLVPRDELMRAITLNGVQFNLARAVGPALGGIIMTLSAEHGVTMLFAINTASFLAILLAISTTPDAPAPTHHDTHVWRQIKEALVFVFHRCGPRMVFIGLGLFSMLAAPLMRMLPLIVSYVYNGLDPSSALSLGQKALVERQFTWLLGIMGIGAVVGGLAMRLAPPWYPKHHLIPLSVFLGGLSITLFSIAPSMAIGGPIIFFCGIFWLWAFNSMMAAMQMLVEDRMRGRVLAICNVMTFGLTMPLGVLLAGGIGEIVSGGAESGFGTQVGVGSLAAVLTLVGIVMLIWRTPEIDAIMPGERGYERRAGFLAGLTAQAHRPRPVEGPAVESFATIGPPPGATGGATYENGRS